MDNFKLALYMKQIDTLKTQISKIELLRELRGMSTIDRWSGIKETQFNSEANIFKCMTKMLQTYPGIESKCPNFISEKISELHDALIKYICETQKIEFKKVCDVFQFVEVVILPRNIGSYFEQFNTIVGSNSLPFKVQHNISSISKFSNLLNNSLRGRKYTPNTLSLIFQLENLKHSLPKTLYTLIEAALDEAYTDLQRDGKLNLKEDAEDITTQMQIYSTLGDTISKRLQSCSL